MLGFPLYSPCQLEVVLSICSTSSWLIHVAFCKHSDVLCCYHVDTLENGMPLLQIKVSEWPKAFQAMRFDSLITNMDIEGSGFVVRDNIMMNNRGRGLLVKASNGLIERNTILGPAWWGMQVRIPSVKGSFASAHMSQHRGSHPLISGGIGYF